MTTSPPTADELELAIANALKARDMAAVVDLLRVLVTVDPARASDVYDVIQIGQTMSNRLSRDGGPHDEG